MKAYTDRFGRVDIDIVRASDDVTVRNSHGKIAEGVWCEQMGLLDFDFVAPFDNAMPERIYRELRDVVEETIERRFNREDDMAMRQGEHAKF